jgi:hypothetical protein
VNGITLFKVKFNKEAWEDKNKVSYFNIIQLYPEFIDMCKTPDRCGWVFTESSHRKEVRVVDEETYNLINSGKSGLTLVHELDHIYSKRENSFPWKTMYATKAYHQLGDISRDEISECIVSESDDEFYYGQWREGFGYIDVKFPKETTFESKD